MSLRTAPTTVASDAALAGIWQEHHRYLLDVAYRMLGTVSEAEDAVQEGFARLLQVDLGEIGNIRGWLVVAVSRICLDNLRSARSRREVYTGPWLPEPVIPPPGKGNDPADAVTLDDSVRMAMLLVLERLSPAERAVFVLHDVFQFSFAEVAEIVGRTPAACRQLASRARRQVRAHTSPGRFRVDPADAARLADRFIAAASSGDLGGLMQVLDPQVTGWVDTQGAGFGTPGTFGDPRKVAQNLLHFIHLFDVRLEPIPVNGEPGVLAYQGDRLVGVIALSYRDGLIHELHAIATPAKLAYVASMLNVPTLAPGEGLSFTFRGEQRQLRPRPGMHRQPGPDA